MPSTKNKTKVKCRSFRRSGEVRDSMALEPPPRALAPLTTASRAPRAPIGQAGRPALGHVGARGTAGGPSPFGLVLPRATARAPASRSHAAGEASPGFSSPAQPPNIRPPPLASRIPRPQQPAPLLDPEARGRDIRKRCVPERERENCPGPPRTREAEEAQRPSHSEGLPRLLLTPNSQPAS